MAGDAPAISSFLRHLITGFASVGLEIALDKTEVLPACSSSQSFSPEDFPGCTWNSSRNFKLLGARHRRPQVVRAPSIQEGCQGVVPSSCNRQVRGRSRGLHPPPLLHWMGQDPLLLQNCPPTLQPDALAQADVDVRDALGRLVGSPLSADDWRLASLGISAGGIGARSAQEHAPAAYIASLSATAALSARIWPAFDEYDLDSGCLRSDAEFELQSRVPEGAISDSLSPPPMIESFILHDRSPLVHGSHPFRSPPDSPLHHQSPAQAPYGNLGRRFSLSTLRANLGPTGVTTPPPCPRGGDRVGRHNAVRDVFNNIARDCCSLAPIKEKNGLLPPRAPDDGDPPLPPAPPDPSGRDLCRPPDIWVPHGPSGLPKVWDFSICGALCPSIWSKADWDSGTVFQHVESRKSSSTTPRPCVPARGFFFRPLVLEAGGRLVRRPRFPVLLARPRISSLHLPLLPPTPASLSLSASQQPSTAKTRGAILKRSPEGLTPDHSSLGLQVLPR